MGCCPSLRTRCCQRRQDCRWNRLRRPRRHSLLTSREVVPSCAEDHLSPLDTLSQLLTVNTTSHPALQSLSEMSPSPELNPLNKCSTLFNKSHTNSTAHLTNKTTS